VDLSNAGIIAGLAIADALNPFSIAALVYLLSTDRPLERGLAFAAGTFVTYFAGGGVLLQGWQALVSRLVPLLPTWAPSALEIAAGAVCLAVAVWIWRKSSNSQARTPVRLGLAGTIVFALASTAADLPTAIPYFAAVDRIVASTTAPWAQGAWLVVYNLVYISPLLAMIAIQIVLQSRARPILARVQTGVNWSFANLLPPALLLVGLYLLSDGALRLSRLGEPIG